MAGRSRWLRRPQRLSLLARLLWTFLVPLAVVLVVVGIASTAALQHQLVSQVDSRLSSAVTRSANAANGVRPPPQGWSYDPDGDGGGPNFLAARGQGPGTLGARVVDGVTTQAGVLTERGSNEFLTADQRRLIAALPADGRRHTVDLGGDLGDYRVVATRMPDGDVLVTGLPLAGTYAAVAKLITVEVAAGLAGLVVTALAGILVVRRTLRPLSHVAATATRVTELGVGGGGGGVARRGREGDTQPPPPPPPPEVVLPERVPEADTDPRTEVGRVGTALNRLLDHVEQSLHARQASEMQVRQFVADASHELRTPLASIRGYAEFFRRQQRDGSTPTLEDVSHTLRRVESEALRMSALVDELLLLARLDAGRDLELGEVDLTMIAVDATSDAHVAAPGHRWHVDVLPTAVLVHGDAARLHQVVANLLGNVRAHTPDGTTATVRLRVEDGTAVLSVIDDGPGIPPALQGHVFERFARGDASRSRAAGSTGLGLAIVEAVVAAHDGTVTVASRPGRTEFTVRLPGAVLGDPEPDLVDEDAPLAAPVRSVTGG